MKKGKILKKSEIEEFVNKDLDLYDLENDEFKPTNDNEIHVSPGETSFDYEKLAIQPNIYYFGAGGTPFITGNRLYEDNIEECETFFEMIFKKHEIEEDDMVNPDEDIDTIPNMDDYFIDKLKLPIIKEKYDELLESVYMNKLKRNDKLILIYNLIEKLNVDKNKLKSIL
jgi:hypothetical protein